MNILWLLLNNPIISKCLVAGSPFHLLPWHSVLRWDHEDQEFFDRTVPTSPSCRGSLPPKWHGRYSKPHHQSEPEHDDENHPSTPGTGRTPMLQPAPREVIERNLPFLSMTWLKSWRDPRTFLFGECTPTSAPCPCRTNPLRAAGNKCQCFPPFFLSWVVSQFWPHSQELQTVSKSGKLLCRPGWLPRSGHVPVPCENAHPRAAPGKERASQMSCQNLRETQALCMLGEAALLASVKGWERRTFFGRWSQAQPCCNPSCDTRNSVP